MLQSHDKVCVLSMAAQLNIVH